MGEQHTNAESSDTSGENRIIEYWESIGRSFSKEFIAQAKLEHERRIAAQTKPQS